MIVARLEATALRPAGRELFRGLDWALARDARTGLVGASGVGKSSLLRLLVGAIQPDAGSVWRAPELEIGLLPQTVLWPEGTTLLAAASVPPASLARVETELTRIEERLADPAVYADEARLSRTLARQERALARWEALGGERYAGRLRALLEAFGFDGSRDAAAANELSGGEKKLVALAGLAAAEPGLLLLDEPDNHLDLAAKARLERFIASYPGGVVIVSHDRYLLDSTATEISEIERERLTTHRGNYSAHAAARELRKLREAKRYADQQKEVARIEASIARFEHWASLVVNERHIKQARSRRKALDRMRASEDWVGRPQEQRRMQLELRGSRGSERAVLVRDLALGFDRSPVFDGVGLEVRHGERVGIVGPNGCGKSTLLRVIAGELEPWRGEVRLGPSSRLGYYAQQHDALEDWLGRSSLDWVRDAAPLRREEAVGVLLRFALSYAQLEQPIRNLSGGERSRLVLARLMLEQPNVLLLDEPTNHLDIDSAEVLESALDEFEGAILVVSHDRYFLDTVVDRIEAFENGRLEWHPGGYTDYLERTWRRGG